MDLVRALADPIADCHAWLEATMASVTMEQVHWRPPGVANPISAVYAHVVLGADFTLHARLNGLRPLALSHDGGKPGLSELPAFGDWHGWAGRLRMDLDVFRPYARSVYSAWTQYLSGLSADDLDRTIDLSALQMGQRPLAAVLAMQIEHFSCHCGEIACLKGLQGEVGFRAGTSEGRD